MMQVAFLNGSTESNIKKEHIIDVLSLESRFVINTRNLKLGDIVISEPNKRGKIKFVICFYIQIMYYFVSNFYIYQFLDTLDL